MSVTLEMQRNIRAAIIWARIHSKAVNDPKYDPKWIQDCANYRDQYLKAAGFPGFDGLAKHPE